MTFENMSENLLNSLNQFWIKIAEFAPSLLTAFLILIVGYLLAKLIGYFTTKLLAKLGLDKLSGEIGLLSMLKRAGIETTVSKLSGTMIKWLIMFTFLITATEMLGLARVSSTIDELVLYIPKMIGAAIILIIGLSIAHFAQSAIKNAAESMALSYAKGLSSFISGVIIIVAFSLAFAQLELETELLNYIILALLFSVCAGVAISLGLGSRDLSTRILSGIYVRELLKPGQTIEALGYTGVIVQIGTVKTIVQDKKGNMILIPNDELIKNTISTKAVSS